MLAILQINWGILKKMPSRGEAIASYDAGLHVHVTYKSKLWRSLLPAPYNTLSTVYKYHFQLSLFDHLHLLASVLCESPSIAPTLSLHHHLKSCRIESHSPNLSFCSSVSVHRSLPFQPPKSDLFTKGITWLCTCTCQSTFLTPTKCVELRSILKEIEYQNKKDHKRSPIYMYI